MRSRQVLSAIRAVGHGVDWDHTSSRALWRSSCFVRQTPPRTQAASSAVDQQVWLTPEGDRDPRADVARTSGSQRD
jgi:hypothetical protein